MKTLVLYASKYGCTADCVNHLKEKLQGEVTTANLKSLGRVDLQGFDWIVIGGPIYMGKLHKAVKGFCEGSLEALQGQSLALFLCCTTPEQADAFFKSNFPPALLE